MFPANAKSVVLTANVATTVTLQAWIKPPDAQMVGFFGIGAGGGGASGAAAAINSAGGGGGGGPGAVTLMIIPAWLLPEALFIEIGGGGAGGAGVAATSGGNTGGTTLSTRVAIFAQSTTLTSQGMIFVAGGAVVAASAGLSDGTGGPGGSAGSQFDSTAAPVANWAIYTSKAFAAGKNGGGAASGTNAPIGTSLLYGGAGGSGYAAGAVGGLFTGVANTDAISLGANSSGYFPIALFSYGGSGGNPSATVGSPGANGAVGSGGGGGGAGGTNSGAGGRGGPGQLVISWW